MFHTDSDAPTLGVLQPARVTQVKAWKRQCSNCGWSLRIVDYVKPFISRIQCPKCGSTTDLMEE